MALILVFGLLGGALMSHNMLRSLDAINRASGEIMAGNILGRGYLAGFGMSIGTVFGRIAGREAAKHALA